MNAIFNYYAIVITFIMNILSIIFYYDKNIIKMILFLL